jgi:hypothetical protein
MRRAFAGCLVVTLLVGVSAGRAMADESSSRKSLAGLRGVQVTASIWCDEKPFKDLVSEEALRTKIELKLRQSGIRVLSESEAAKDLRYPTLDLGIIAVPNSTLKDETTSEPLGYAMALRLSLNQGLWIVDSKGTVREQIFGDTWSKTYVLAYGRNVITQGRVDKLVSDMTESFANDWLAAHGK